MKKTLRRFVSLLICTLMLVAGIGYTAFNVSAQTNTIYVSETGNDANNGAGIASPVKTLKKAAELAGASGTVIVMDKTDVAPGDTIPACKITGLSPDAVINVTGWCMRFGGPATIENVTLNACAAWSYILANGNKLVIGDGVTVTANEGVNTALSIRGGGEGNQINGSCEVVIKSGVWKNFVGGTRNKDVIGNTHVTIYDGATVASVNVGNENAKDVTSAVKGSATVKIVGKSNPVPGNITGTVEANRYIDVTEYEGNVPTVWRNSGMTILADASKIPADAKPASEGGVVGIPGKVFDTGSSTVVEQTGVKIYLSDNGSDSQDGTSISKAVKTLAKANSLAGEGGTIVIADNYTHKTGDKITVSKLEGFTQDCVFDVANWCCNLGTNCTIDNITLNVSYNWAFILCNGFKLTVGENVKSTKSGAATVPLSIRGGGEGLSVGGSTSITLKSGTWGSVVGGTKKGNVNGNTSVTIYPGASVNMVTSGNDGASEGNTIAGTGTVKVVGSKHGISKINGTTIVKGGLVLDTTEYTGSDKASLEKLGSDAGYAVWNDKNKAPEVVIPEVPKPEVPKTGNITKVVPGDGVVYVSDKGDNSKDGKTPENAVKTLDAAFSKGGADPIIVVVDVFTIPNANKIAACTFTGYSSDSVLNISAWSMALGGKMTIENVTLTALQKYSYILANGNSLTIGENVTVAKGPGVTTNLGIRGGGEGAAVNTDTNVVIKSGTWGDVHGGTRNASINANTFLTIHEGATVASANIGNNGVKEGNTFTANGVIKLVGNPTVSKIEAKPGYCTGEMILDLTEFTGAQNESWAKLGAKVVTDKAELPAYVSEHFAKNLGIYDLSGLTNFRYVSDSGDDANDGLTKDKPMKTIKAAVTAMGEGGTVVVTGTYTHKEYTAGLPSFNITSECNKDKFVMELWALHTNNTKIYNLNFVVARDHNFILHCGKPLHIGKNVECSFTNGAKVNVGIRGNESGDVAMTDITIESGSWAIVFAGTKNANLLGNAAITVTGGTLSGISVGNDSATGRILGSTKITLKGKPVIQTISDKMQTDGYSIVDISEFTGALPTIADSLTVITDKNANTIPINSSALFINGYPDGTFLPEKVMTRAEAITVAAKVAGLTTIYEAPETTAFTDLKADDWYATNVKYLESFGALSFWGNTLDANKGITRGEFVKLISGMIVAAEGSSPAFSDVPATHPFYNEIILAAKAGLVNGYPDGTFLPDNTLKRSEIVTILNRLTKRNTVASNAVKITKFTDIAGHWAAPNIIAASCAPTTDGLIIWYTGDIMAGNSPVDKSTLDLSTTKAVLEGVDVNDANAVAAAVENYTVKRRAEIANTATTVNVTGTKYYVSANGNDANDGKTPETAWQTLEKVNGAALAEGDGVFFKRGDIFRGQLTTKKGVTYSAYGEGAKPALYGSAKNYANIGYWQKTNKENIYVSSETFSADVGLIVFDHGKAWTEKGVMNKKGFIGALTKDLEMFHDTNDNKVYLYSTSDPNTRWSSIEIAPGRNGVTGNGNNVTLDNLTIKYSGAHGIGYGDGTTGLTVQNCEIGWIGGMIQPSRTAEGVRFGNGVEIYLGCKDYTITNCHIYQCYDAGITHQYFQTRDSYVNMENIKYTDNVIEYCVYDIEYVNAQPADKGIMKDVEISGNLLIHGGEGFGNQRPDHGEAVIKGWSSINHAVNNVYYDNVIMTMEPICSLVHLGVDKLAYMPELYGNIFVAKDGTNFGIYGIRSSQTKVVFDEKITDTTIGLDDNTFVFVK
ncbi:MAG: hypothetical protein E7583_02020 [Ruminococcaceae bacterium]|nr:hypothetical protein [Oscillospiraceae bacterium]